MRQSTIQSPRPTPRLHERVNAFLADLAAAPARTAPALVTDVMKCTRCHDVQPVAERCRNCGEPS